MSEVTITIDKTSYNREPFMAGEIYYRHNFWFCICIKKLFGATIFKPLKSNSFLRWFQIKYLRTLIYLNWI